MMRNYFKFDKLITQLVVQVLHWILVVACVLVLIGGWSKATTMEGVLLAGIFSVLLTFAVVGSYLILRALLEMMVIQFKIYEELRKKSTK